MVSTEVYGGYWSLGDRGHSPFQGGTNIFFFKDVFDLIRGKHAIRTGIDLRDNQINVGTKVFQDGFWLIGSGGYFSGYGSAPGNPEADLLLGITGGVIHDQSCYGPVTGRRWKIIQPFVEDDWRVTSSLNFNLGLALDMTTPETEIHNRMSNSLPITGKLLIAGQNRVSQSACIKMFWGAYEPRVGLTWKILGSDKTVLRLGFGIYHDSAWSQGVQGLWQNPPNLGESDNFAHPESKEMSRADINRSLVNTLTVARNELKYVAEVETDFGNLPFVICSISDMNQVFLNLLVNAAYAIGDVVGGTGQKGTIRIRTSVEGPMALITIADTGAGIPEDIRDRIFDPFFTTKEVGRGTGQGLAIAPSVVDRHKGSLTFESEVGTGTTFRICLPIDGIESRG